jgi:iron-sulfur cluster repair protein YtfE (RIC family)
MNAHRLAEDSPLAMLLECHGWIRRFLREAWKLSEADSSDLEAVQSSATETLNFFLTVMPIHIEEEQETMLPRLAGLSSSLDKALAHMVKDHEERDETLQEVIGYCQILSRHPESLEKLRESFRRSTRHLAVDLESHLMAEERDIFPNIEALPHSEQATMVAEMRARRKSLNLPCEVITHH